MLYKNYRKADVKNAKPGYAPNAFIIPISWIGTYAEPIGNTHPGDRFIITDSHEMITEKGAIAVYCVPKTTEGNGEMVGEMGARRYAWRPKIIIPGDSPEKQDLVESLINEDFILLIKDSVCGANEWVQFGCDCDPTNVDTSTFVSGMTGEGRKQTEFNLLTYCKFFYRGAIVELPDPEEEDLEP